MHKFVLVLLATLSPSAPAQTPYLVKDINTTYSLDTSTSSPTEFRAHGDKTFFVASANASGTELWVTDGTSAGTSMVADIIQGSASSNPNSLQSFNGRMFFNARTVDQGIELWSTDGTAAGTQRLMDINPGPSSSQPFWKTVYKNRMLFTADDGTNGRELWITDGTVSGTRMLKDITPGSVSSSPSSFVEFGGVLYFGAAGGLWKTDGTESGTVKVATVTVWNLTVVGTRLFVEGSTAETGRELWISDGSESGTRLIKEIMPGTAGAFTAISYYRAPLGERLLFVANDGVHGIELWISDGTADGTRMVRDLTPGAAGTWNNAFSYLTAFAGRAYFVADAGGHGTELWVTDGTEAGTQLFLEIEPGAASSYVSSLTVSGGKLFFTANDEAWVSDGTPGGTRRITGAGGVEFTTLGGLWPVQGKVYFRGITPLTDGEPWVSDGTDAGSRMIANLAADGAPSSRPHTLTAGKDLLFFHAVEEAYEASLWRSDGTAGGTFKLSEMGQHPPPLTAAGSFVFYKMHPANKEWLMSDGTVQGTGSANAFMQRFGGRETNALYPFGETLFATAYYGTSASETSLWRTVAAANASAQELGSSNPTGFIEFAGRYAFYAGVKSGSYYDRALWTTDGTAAGTYAIVPDLEADNQSLSGLTIGAGTIYFLKAKRDEPMTLWKSDGTFDGTVAVKALPSGVSHHQQIEAAGRRVFFTHGGALWTSDGTETGTIPLPNVKMDTFADDDLEAVGSRVVFTQHDDSNNTEWELWSSDGTSAGTRLLLENGPLPPQVRNIDGIVYFTGFDDAHGREVWTTDGTPEGTKLLYDVNPGPASSNAHAFTKVGSTLYFAAYTEGTGDELWAVALPSRRLSIADARMSEGDAGSRVARFDVSLTTPAEQPVTVQYATSDGSARAGEDYEAAAGTLTFASGETNKPIDVRILGDTTIENNETWFVTLSSAAAAMLIRAEGTGIIEDDDQAADVAAAPSITRSGGIYDAVRVSNVGPSSATNIVVTSTATPFDDRNRCLRPCFIPQLLVGGSAIAGGEYFPALEQTYMSATATSRERDPNPGNNTTTWTLGPSRRLAMDAAYLTPGQTATVSVGFFDASQLPSSSNPSVVAINSPMTTVEEGLGTFTVRAVAVGTSLIDVGNGQYPLLVTVVAPGTTPRWPGGVSIETRLTTTHIDVPMMVTITPSGTAPVTGARATGTVVVRSGGQELARRNISGVDPIEFPVYFRFVGSVSYEIEYSGDANFLPQSRTGGFFTRKGNVSITGDLERVADTEGTFVLTVEVTGSPVLPPTGTISIVNGVAELARLSLTPTDGGTSVAQVTLTNLPVSPTVIVNYLGDTMYEPASQQIRTVPARRRSVRK